MKKIVIAIGLIFSSSVFAELTNLHFYAQKEHYKEGIIEFELSSDETQLEELAVSKNGVKNAPIHIAVLEKNIDALKNFAKYEKYVDVRNSNEQTALMLALKMGLREYAKVLINAGAEVDTVDTQGNYVDAYAKVGGINLDKLYKARKRDIVKENVEEENNSSFQEEEIIDSEYYNRLDRLEENFIGVVDIITKHDSVIKNIKDSKLNVKEELQKAANEIIKLKSNLDKQAKILIPIVKSNKYTIDAINKQIKIIDKKSIELTSKIESLNELKDAVKQQMEEIKNMESSLDQTKEDLLKPELEQILESGKLDTSVEIKESDLLGSDLDLNNDLLEEDETKIVLIDEVEPTLFEKVLEMIKKHIMVIALIGLLAILLIYILIKNKNKGKKDEKEKESQEDEDFDDEDDAEDSSQLNKTLSQIEIESNEEDSDDEDVDIDLDDLNDDELDLDDLNDNK